MVNGLCCIHANDSTDGCGHGSFCPQCHLRKTIEGVLSSGDNVKRAELQHTFMIDGNQVNPWLEVSVERVSIDNKKHVLMAISDITEHKETEKVIVNLSKFPSENPNPVLRIAKDGEVLYSNKAGELLLNKWGSGIGKTVPEKWCNLVAEALKSQKVKVKKEEAGLKENSIFEGVR